MSQPPGGPPLEGPEPEDDPPPGSTERPGGAPYEDWRPPPYTGAPPPPGWAPPPQHGPEPYGPQGYGPPTPYGGPQPYGQQPFGQQPYGPQPYGPPYGPGPYAPAPPRSRRGLVVGLIAGFIVLVVCVAVTAFLLGRDDKGGTPTALPPGVTATASAAEGTLTMVKPGGGRVLVDVYEDFQCPICRDFHRTNDGTLKALAGEGRAKVVYHPIVIFDREPLLANSTRAASAARCVTGGAAWLSFQDQVFAHQPAEGTAGFSAADLESYGRAAGAGDSGFATCVRTERYAPAVRAESAVAIAGGVFGTPTVKINGRVLPTNETLTAQGLRSAVVAAG